MRRHIHTNFYSYAHIDNNTYTYTLTVPPKKDKKNKNKNICERKHVRTHTCKHSIRMSTSTYLRTQLSL